MIRASAGKRDRRHRGNCGRTSVQERARGAGMGIVVNLDVMMAKRKMSLTELAGEVDITLANL